MTENNLKSLSQQRLESSSFIALPNSYKAKHVLIKVIWILLTMFSSGWCGWFMFRSISDYLSYDVITKTNIKYLPKMIFPMVTLCNLNLFATNYSSKFIRNYLKNYSSEIDENHPNFAYHIDINLAVRNFILNNKNDKESKYLFGRKLNDIIIRCEFDLLNCDLDQDFDAYFDDKFGVCFRFNSGKNMNGSDVNHKFTYNQEVTEGLRLELFIGSASENENMFSEENGFHVFISNDTNLYDSVSISPGFSTKISIEKYSIIKMPKPFSNCVAKLDSIDSYSSLLFKKTLKSSHKAYLNSNCFKLCIQKLIGDILECQFPDSSLIYYENMKLCDFKNTNDNFINSKDNQTVNEVFKDDLFDINKFYDKCDCPIECEKNYYSFSSSQAEFPTKFYSYYLKENYLVKEKLGNRLNDSNYFETLRKNVAKLHIYYKSLQQTEISESPRMQMADLVANLGGTLGLFLGISCLSFVEFVDFLAHIIMIFVNKYHKNHTKIEKLTSDFKRTNVVKNVS